MESFDFSSFPTLTTPRLLLRQLTPSDAEAVYLLRSDYEVVRYNGVILMRTLDQAHDLISAITHAYTDHLEIRWAITLRDTPDVLIGICGYNYWIRHDHRASVGYDLIRAYWGHGYITEAVRAILEFGFSAMDLNRIEADSDHRNAASIRVLHKLGFHQEGTQQEQFYQDGEFQHLLLFALLRRDHYLRPAAD
jgi:[ribosomal protein S5]-alanine N-acetyltransferase